MHLYFWVAGVNQYHATCVNTTVNMGYIVAENETMVRGHAFEQTKADFPDYDIVGIDVMQMPDEAVTRAYLSVINNTQED